MGFLTKLFSSYSEKQIKRIIPTVDAIEALADKFSAMTDDELRSYTDKLKGDLADGKTFSHLQSFPASESFPMSQLFA